MTSAGDGMVRKYRTIVASNPKVWVVLVKIVVNLLATKAEVAPLEIPVAIDAKLDARSIVHPPILPAKRARI